MQQYKSHKNLLDEKKNEKRLEKRRGEIPYSLEANQSGRIVLTFTKEYSEVPIVLTSTVVLEGSEFDVNAILTNVTQSNFTINIQNTSNEHVKGTIYWILM